MDDLYREIIIERNQTPHFKGVLDPNDISFEDENPLCGDVIRVDLRLDNENRIREAAFSGHGCAISQASADLLMESLIGKEIEQVKKLTKQDILDNLGIELGPVRLKCALLSLKALKAGVYGLYKSNDDLVEGE